MAGPITEAVCQVLLRQAIAFWYMRTRNDLGAHRLARRLEDAARDAAHEDHRVDRHDADAREQARRRAEHEERGRAAREHEQRPTLIARRFATIGEISRGKRDADEGQRLGETDQAEGERVVRDP